MNQYVQKNKDTLPLLNYCSGPGTQEDGIILHLLESLDRETGYCVEFGQRSLGGGTLGRIAKERGFSLLNIDSEAAHDEDLYPWGDERKWSLRKRRVSPLNINSIFDESGVPLDPLACVIDVDGMDYWCLLAILQKRRPSLIICEYNCHIPAGVATSLAFNPNHQYSQTKEYGASYSALLRLARSYGYKLVHMHGPLNLYFTRNHIELSAGDWKVCELENLSNQALVELSSTDEFYDSFHPGQKPSWYSTSAPDTSQAPWIILDKIGEQINAVKIDEINLAVYEKDKGGDHYRLRSHKEDSVSPLWRLIRHRLAPSIIIDIGANYGYTSILLAKRLGAQQLIAVEPDARLIDILKSNLKENLGGAEFEVIHAAISGAPDGVTTLGVNPVSTQDNRITAEQGWAQVIAPAKSFDSILSMVPIEKRIFIKSDTQGFDINVIRSGHEQLSKRANWILRCEFAPYWMESQGFSPIEELEWLCCNYRVFEAPLRTAWNLRFEEVFMRPIEVSHAQAYVGYAKTLNHNGKGWVDLFILP